MPQKMFSANGREYVHQDTPAVVICIDGSEPAYHEFAIAAGRMPWLKGLVESTGTSWGLSLCSSSRGLAVFLPKY